MSQPAQECAWAEPSKCQEDTSSVTWSLPHRFQTYLLVLNSIWFEHLMISMKIVQETPKIQTHKSFINLIYFSDWSNYQIHFTRLLVEDYHCMSALSLFSLLAAVLPQLAVSQLTLLHIMQKTQPPNWRKELDGFGWRDAGLVFANLCWLLRFDE